MVSGTKSKKWCQALKVWFYLNYFSSTELNAMLTRFLLFIFFRYNFYSLVGDFDLLIAFVKEKVGQGQPF